MSEAANILLVDDQERNLDALEAILESTGYTLVRARSADEALLHLLKGEFAAIVCDIKMPGIGGIELAQMIKQRKRTQHIPIVFLTAYSIEQEEMLRGYGVGAVDYLTKPINPEILRLKLGVFVELFRKTRALAEANQALADQVSERERAQEELRIAKEGLEVRVQERTAELEDANRALRESEDRMVLAMQGAAMGIFSQDLRTGKVLWSASMESTLGLPPGSLEPNFDAFLQHVHPDDRQRLRSEMNTPADAGDRFSTEFRFRRADDPASGDERWMSMVGRFVLDSNGRPVHRVGVSTDVTARRNAAQELRALKEAAESANRAKDHFLAVLSHELRTPLTPVMAAVQELLGARPLAPELRESLDLIHRNVELEARLIDDLLDLTRIARGKMELQKSAIDVHPIIEHALRTCDADFRSKQITVAVKLQASGTRLVGDRARLLQIFWNLLKNAAKFTAPGQSVEVRSSDAPGGHIQIQVRDTGVGIEPSRLSRIFEAFDQGSLDVARQFGGLGLGLSIAKALVEMHGGTISAASDGIGHGACFTVTLPVAMMAAETAVPPPAPPATAAAQPVRSRLAASVLLVEDHPDTSRVLARLLRADGYEITTADGVTAALRACDAAGRPFDIFVSDIGLPDGSGLDLMRQLRLRYPRTPAIALSGFGMEEDRLRSREAGFTAHLTKPIDLGTLRNTIEGALLANADEGSSADLDDVALQRP